MDVFGECKADEVVTVSETDLIDAVLNGLQVESLHVPDLLEFAVEHDGIGVIIYSHLLGEGILLAPLRNQEGNGLLDVLQGQFFKL